jgi:hypothetical protein
MKLCVVMVMIAKKLYLLDDTDTEISLTTQCQ